MPDDSELLSRFLDEKSQEAFAEIVRRHLPTVYAAALRRLSGNTHLAEEVAQQVFSDLAHKAQKLRARSSLAGWLFVSARYSASKLLRTETRHLSVLQKRAMDPIEENETTSPTWEGLRPWLDEAIHKLNTLDREAILLRSAIADNNHRSAIQKEYNKDGAGMMMMID